jgi:hypothetical protein
MRKALVALLFVLLVAGCGGSKKPTTMTKEQYIAALDQLCTSANRQVAALRLTTSMKTWKQNGPKAAKIAEQTVKGFEALKPPEELADAAKRHNLASEQIVAAVHDAAEAAQKGDQAKFNVALSKQQNAGQTANLAANQIGATGCA